MSSEDKGASAISGLGARFFSGLKDLILEEDAPKKNNAAASADAEKIATRPPGPVSPAAQATSTPSPMVASLMELVLSRPSAYTALTDAIAPLEEIIPDEMTRYRAAFAVIKKNRSLDQVLQAIDLQHMQILESEVVRFKAQAKEKEDAEVHSRVEEAKRLSGSIESAEAQVINLRKELEERIRTIEEATQRDRVRIDEINREIEEKRHAIAKVQQQFDAAVASVKETLSQAKSKIRNYLA